MIFDLQGNPHQVGIASAGLARCNFPFDLLRPGLKAATGRDSIPVEWADLSRYYTAFLPEKMAVGAHLHVHKDGDTGHPVVVRERVLGLAWYSGKVTLDVSLTSDPQLAAEVLLSEGAHMVDFFYMSNAHRVAVFNAMHPDEQDVPPGTNIVDAVQVGSHACGWFDVGPYRSWVGEAFMGAFTRAFSDVPVSIPFDHPATDQVARDVQVALLPSAPTPPPAPEPVWGTVPGRTYHRQDARGIHVRWWPGPRSEWDSPADAQAASRRPCRICKPAA